VKALASTGSTDKSGAKGRLRGHLFEDLDIDGTKSAGGSIRASPLPPRVVGAGRLRRRTLGTTLVNLQPSEQDARKFAGIPCRATQGVRAHESRLMHRRIPRLTKCLYLLAEHFVRLSDQLPLIVGQPLRCLGWTCAFAVGAPVR
jgi:hypothetical protein